MPDPYLSTDSFAERQSLQHGSIEASSAVQEIISANPGYFVRKGTIIIFAILCVIIAGMYFIRYPDMLEGAATLTTDPLPIRLKSSTGGRIQKLFVVEDAVVLKDQPIAELENSTGYDKAQQLSAIADSTLTALERKDINGLSVIGHTTLSSLGEGQGIFNNLVDAISSYVLVQNQHIYAKRSAGLQSQTARYQSMSSIGNKEKALIMEELRQADERFKANEKLYNDKVISRQEYFDEAAKLRQKKLALEQQTRSALQNSASIADNNKQQADIAYEQTEKEASQLAAIRGQVRNLQNFVQSWKLKYLLYAPYKGKMHFLRPLQVNETINAGEEIGAVVPANFSYIAYVNIPAQGSGKIKQGQKAHLMLDQFPYNEYGYLEGRVGSISVLPQTADNSSSLGTQKSAVYRVSIVLPDTLVTSYHRKVSFNPEMTAQARIITKDRNLLQRLLSGFAGLDR